MEVLYSRDNGNAHVEIYDDGTRIVEWSNGEELNLEYPLSLDVNISNRCDNGCTFCYQNCTKGGKQANMLDLRYLEELPAGTEVAINIQRPLVPNIDEFLKRMHNRDIIVNCTINQNHLWDPEIREKLVCWQRDHLICGIGVSVTSVYNLRDSVEDLDKSRLNLHVINGIHSVDDIIDLSKDFKILVLGYKMVGRGPDEKFKNPTIEYKIAETNNRFQELIDRGVYEIAFDNLALEQLDIKNRIPKDIWDEYYQGDDGTLSFYINAVERTFALNSLVEQNNMYPIRNRNIKEMFKYIKEVYYGKDIL